MNIRHLFHNDSDTFIIVIYISWLNEGVNKTVLTININFTNTVLWKKKFDCDSIKNKAIEQLNSDEEYSYTILVYSHIFNLSVEKESISLMVGLYPMNLLVYAIVLVYK